MKEGYRIELRHLRYFVTVVQQGQYLKAAQTLHISQPSLSNMIKKLEEEVGFLLLERSTRGLRLTESGEILYRHALELLRRFDNMMKEMEEVKQTGSGSISIGLIESTKHWVPQVIRTFKEYYPDVRFQMKEILGLTNVTEALLNYDVHAAITNQELTNEPFISIPIYNENLVLLSHLEDSLGLKAEPNLQDIVDKPLIISTQGFQTREDILQAFSQEQLEPNIMYEFERFETACSLVEQGLGVTFLPENYIKYIPQTKFNIHYIESASLQRTVYLAYVQERHLPPYLYELFDYIHQFFK